MVLPFVASLLATGNLNQHAINLTQKYQIAPDTTLVNNASAGWPVINNCIESYCAAQNTSEDGTAGCLQKNNKPQSYIFYPNVTWYDNNGPDDSALNITFNRPDVCICHSAVYTRDTPSANMASQRYSKRAFAMSLAR